MKSLPSYETVSFAVKSISQEFNWTEAVIFAAGKVAWYFTRQSKEKTGAPGCFVNLYVSGKGELYFQLICAFSPKTPSRTGYRCGGEASGEGERWAPVLSGGNAKILEFLSLLTGALIYVLTHVKRGAKDTIHPPLQGRRLSRR